MSEMTPEQIRQQEKETTDVFSGIVHQIHQRAHATYSVARSADFNACLAHLSSQDLDDMTTAHRYTCPQCGRLLKDRSARVPTEQEAR